MDGAVKETIPYYKERRVHQSTNMTLPTDFKFSQGSLQDYVDCPKRFQLRYLQRLRWPALEVEAAMENELYLRQGAAFHRLIQQHLSGVPAEMLSRTVTDDSLRRWWRHYLESGLPDVPKEHYPEATLSAPLGGHRLVAKYDLVAVEPGQRAVIVDWKTNRKRSRRDWLEQRLQTRVYPYLLVRSGAQLNGGQRIEPEQVTMVYWFANFPATPERFTYDGDRYAADADYLSKLIAEIKERFRNPVAPDFSPREGRHCRYCRYRSFCQQGGEVEVEVKDKVEAEVEGEASEGFDFDFDFDFEQIAEAGY